MLNAAYLGVRRKKMPKFEVHVAGERVPYRPIPSNEWLSFSATRYVEASDIDLAKEMAIEGLVAELGEKIEQEELAQCKIAFDIESIIQLQEVFLFPTEQPAIVFGFKE